MTDTAKLLAGYNQFYQKYFIENPQTYQKLVRDGQSPHTLVIACSDSRVDPSIVLNTEPGDIFVIRNVANLVPPFEDCKDSCHGTSAAIEFAVNTLMVQDVIIMGHSQCGGIHTLMTDKSDEQSFISNWIHIADVAKIAAAHAHSEEEACELCEKAAIKVSLLNLLTFPFIKEKVISGQLELHGWYLNIDTGKLDIIKF